MIGGQEYGSSESGCQELDFYKVWMAGFQSKVSSDCFCCLPRLFIFLNTGILFYCDTLLQSF